MGNSPATPASDRDELRRELRRLRQARGLTIEQVAAELECSTSKAVRIEGGTVSVGPSELRLLLALYGVPTGPRHDELLALARGARRRTWTSAFGDAAAAAVLRYLAREAEADRVVEYDPVGVPSLLHCRSYAVMAARHAVPHLDGQRWAELTMRRQEVLAANPQVRQLIVVHAAALRRPAGGPVASELATHVDGLARHPRVRVVVVPDDHPVWPPPAFVPTAIACRASQPVALQGWLNHGGGVVVEDQAAIAHWLANIDALAEQR